MALLAAVSSLGTAVARARAQAGATTVLVTITDSGLELAPSTVTAGSVVFKVVNKGKIARDFEIAGKRTPTLATGRSVSLKTELAKRPYRYLSVGQGHTARLSGFVGVFARCTNPTASTVTVQITLGQITLSQSTVPCGTVTFVVTNTDASVIHDFNVSVPTDAKGGVLGPRLQPGKTASTTVNLPFKGVKVYYYCREFEHDEQYGETGSLTVV